MIFTIFIFRNSINVVNIVGEVHMDNNDGRIMVEILLDKNDNSYCKWAFADN